MLTFEFQIIIPGSWIFSIILNTPTFLVANVNSNFCGYIWPEQWMAKAFTLTWSVMVFLSLLLMVGMYSRAVYTLWFKRKDDDQLTNQQRVSAGKTLKVTFSPSDNCTYRQVVTFLGRYHSIITLQLLCTGKQQQNSNKKKTDKNKVC